MATKSQRLRMTPAEINADANNVCTFLFANPRFGRKVLEGEEVGRFEDVEDMVESIVDRWNYYVNEWDTVFILGTFAVDEVAVYKYAKMLRGRKILIKSKFDFEDNQIYLDAGFAEVYSYPLIYRQKYILSPKYIAPDNRFRVLYTYMPKGRNIIPLTPNLMYVSMEALDFTPVHMKTLAKQMGTVGKMMNEYEEKIKQMTKGGLVLYDEEEREGDSDGDD